MQAQSHSFYKRYSIVGPGGRKCSCCYPAPGKSRREAEKHWKRTEKQQAQKLFEQELATLKETD